MIHLGDRAVLFDLPPGRSARELLATLKSFPGVVDVVIAEESGAIVFGPKADRAPVMEALAAPTDPERAKIAGSPPKKHVVEVVYDGEDLDELATATGLSTKAIVDAHVARELEVAMMGFMPGFAYLRGMDRRLFVPRRKSPRSKVPAGGMAIAAHYTGIYPFSSPGGWHLVGHASGFHPIGAEGARFGVGDLVKLQRVTKLDPAERDITPVPPSAPDDRAHLLVNRVKGLAIAIDGGRRGRMHEGIPHSGPLVPAALARANAFLGNAAEVCAIEVAGALEVTAKGGFVMIADDEGRERVLGPDATHVVASKGDRVRYLAVPGGFDLPFVLGSQTTLTLARLGGYAGRKLQTGDVLVPTHGESTSPRELPPVNTALPIAFVQGPDATDEIVVAIVSGTFKISTVSDRTGVRLDGPKLEPAKPASGRSGPMVLGAMQLTSSGMIILGPDHPTTGGYPIVGVLSDSTRDSFFARSPGATVRFGVADPRPV